MDAGELQAAVDTACTEHGVPSVSAAVDPDGVLYVASSGIATVASGVPMTTDTLMHGGSITKVMNCTLLMQFVDEGRIALERPVVEYLPAFRLGDTEATRAITVEMLVNHTSGIGGDLLP